MIDEAANTLRDLIHRVGRYPEDAFLFVREGLSYAAEEMHGPETDAHRALYRFLSQQDLDWDDLIQQYHGGALPEPVVEAIQEAGGVEALNRHVGGRELCWALRDFALKRWGIMARVVLESWNIRATNDFGRIIFGFIDFDLMRKEDGDALEDFTEAYSFAEVFEEPYRDRLLRGDADCHTA